MKNKIFLCAISNISSGRCSEDCVFCTQSIQHKADIDRYYKKDIQEIVNQAVMARANKAVGFCLVSATKSLNSKMVEFISEISYEIKKKEKDLALIGCCGMADIDSLKAIKLAGIEVYNHNLETSKEFYPNICKTHNWSERYETCENVRSAGLAICTGGIFGLGESHEDRISMLKSIASLKPFSSPINFYHPNDALPLKIDIMGLDEAIECVKLSRKYLPDSILMVAGGREIVFKDNQDLVFKAGANSIVIGDYLTTKGKSPKKDLEEIENMGYEFAQNRLDEACEF
jgi:biotin synthase